LAGFEASTYGRFSDVHRGPEAFHGIGVDIAHHIDFGRVVNATMGVAKRLAFLLQIGKLIVGRVLIGVDCGLWQDVSAAMLSNWLCPLTLGVVLA
jgi:hypothetical protein